MGGLFAPCASDSRTRRNAFDLHIVSTLYINSSFRVYIFRDPLTAETTCCSASPLGTRGGDGRDDAGRRSAGARFGSAFTPHISATERTRRIIRYWPSPLLPARQLWFTFFPVAASSDPFYLRFAVQIDLDSV